MRYLTTPHLGEIFKLFDISIRIGEEGPETFFNLEEIREGKGDVDIDNPFDSGYFPERE